ncbi:MAG: M18 family aminopeptidase [Oligoflexales bacterium]|nr:M18 family aminopeptidase [Oligoflexales bacterium]
MSHHLSQETTRCWEELKKFIAASPTPFHCVQTIAETLTKQGFKELNETGEWIIADHQGYFIRKAGSIIAFKQGETKKQPRLQIIGTHTDSPGLKIKPNADQYFENYHSLGVEVYGGALLSTWFDRDLSIAGRLSYLDSENKLAHKNIDFRRPVAIIPNLAIHLSPGINEERHINKQKELPPLICQFASSAKKNFNSLLAEQLFTEHAIKCKEVLAFDLFLYDVQQAALVGINNDFYTSARLDNQLSCFLGLKALLESKSQDTAMLVCKDHEEVGSGSDTGAEGPFLKYALERISYAQNQDYYHCIARSFFVSLDNAHAIHPNHFEKHDAQHVPLLNGGPVIKSNANQNYATMSDSAAYFEWLCRQVEVPVQKFVARNDMRCGSTIGPITASLLGIKTIDIGVPTFAMHSIRESAGTHDLPLVLKALIRFYED